MVDKYLCNMWLWRFLVWPVHHPTNLREELMKKELTKQIEDNLEEIDKLTQKQFNGFWL